jgi:hypothetical protein
MAKKEKTSRENIRQAARTLRAGAAAARRELLRTLEPPEHGLERGV